MSKSLLKLLDNSIFPACIMILGKLVGVVVSLWAFNVPYTIKDYFSNVYSLRFVVQAENLKIITTYSDLIMYVVLALFFSITIFRAIFFHSSHITPSLVTKLANTNLLKLIQGSSEIYHSATVWLIFMWLSNVLVIVNVFSGNTDGWVGIACSISSLLLTLVLFQDVYREIQNIKHKPGGYLLN